MRTLRLRVVKKLPKGLTASQWQRPGLSYSGSLSTIFLGRPLRSWFISEAGESAGTSVCPLPWAEAETQRQAPLCLPRADTIQAARTSMKCKGNLGKHWNYQTRRADSISAHWLRLWERFAGWEADPAIWNEILRSATYF